MKKNISLLLVSSLLLLVACSDTVDERAEKPRDEHVWKEQTDAFIRAQEAERTIYDAQQQQQRTIEEQGR